jgi:hypothetical protein
MRVDLLHRGGPDPFTIPDGAERVEDIELCRKARRSARALCAAPDFPVAHDDQRDGVAYLSGIPSMMQDGNAMRALSVQR